jgi:hypothetical protein
MLSNNISQITFFRLTWQPLATSGLWASGDFERMHDYLLKYFLLVDMAASHYFRTLGFRRLHAKGLNLSK